MAIVSLPDLVSLMQMEYMEMPGLALTLWQAQRLWCVPREQCEEALKRLVASRFLRETRDGRYVRSSATVGRVDSQPARQTA